MDHLLNDLRFSIRSIRRRPGIMAVAVITLALGIGATTAVFSVLSGVLLRELPYDDASRIVQVWNPFSNEPGVTRGRSSISSLDYADVRSTITSFEELAAYAPPSSFNLTGTDQPERAVVTRATASLFDVLGTEPLIGRAFTADEDAPGGGDVVVLSHALWQRRFGGERSALESVIRLDGVAHRIVGVMPPAFRMPADYLADQPTELWKPLALDPDNLDRGNQWLHVLGRLQPGASVTAANNELSALTQRWIEQGFKIRDLPPYYAVPIEDELFGSVRPALLILLGAVAFVLLIACVNVANLLLTIADARRGEMALRTALGAARSRIVAQLLTESVLLAVIGGVFGLILAWVGVNLLVALEPANIPRVSELRIDGAAFAFTAVVAMTAAILVGLAPALRAARTDLVTELKADSRTTTGSRRQQLFRGGLVTAEVALSFVLVVGAVLMIRSFDKLTRIDLGFDTSNVLTFGVSLPTTDYADPDARIRFHTQLGAQLAALPGVQSAGAARTLPLAARLGGGSIQLEGMEPPRPGEGWPNTRWQVVTPGWFETMRYTNVAGRFIASGDRADGLPVIVVNQTMADMFWPGEDPLGRRVRTLNEGVPWFTVVGVVRDIRHSGVVDQPNPTMYFALEQVPLTRSFTPTAMSFAVRSTTSPLALAGPARRIVRDLDPNIPVSAVRTMDDIAADALAESRFTMLLLSLFAAVALALAVVGIYGLLSHAVSQRTQEIGIRTALGATWPSVLTLLVWKGMRLTIVGVAAGLGAALILTRLMDSLLYDVDSVDPATFVIVPALFVLVALVATYIPARRARAVDAMTALRNQ